jgi:hypothetical protein
MAMADDRFDGNIDPAHPQGISGNRPPTHPYPTRPRLRFNHKLPQVKTSLHHPVQIGARSAPSRLPGAELSLSGSLFRAGFP